MWNFDKIFIKVHPVGHPAQGCRISDMSNEKGTIISANPDGARGVIKKALVLYGSETSTLPNEVLYALRSAYAVLSTGTEETTEEDGEDE